MRKWIAAARMIFVCAFLILYLIVVGIPVLTYCRLISNPAVALRLSKLLDRILLYLAGIRVEVIGGERIPLDRGVVYVGNHRSHADPAALFLVLPGDLRFLAKKELFKDPSSRVRFANHGND